MSNSRQSPQAPGEETIMIRGLACRLHCWGRPDAEPLLLLHGWGDTGATFQFLVDSLGDRWRAIAPDWRGFGDSEWGAGGYWFADYLADLDAILRHVSPDRAAPVVGHSMGGNVAGLYAGVRPERVNALVLIEGFGMPASNPRDAPQRYRLWLDEQRVPADFRTHASIEAFAERLRSRSPQLDAHRARWRRFGDDDALPPQEVGVVVDRGGSGRRRVDREPSLKVSPDGVRRVVPTHEIAVQEH
ncbi:MAG: alpha/beta fold hydrolase, partial [Gammaproteobacteria bacterium]|nr:alpha/beta fold hydrolase [Gammaproteobacteria bacterium]